MVVMQIVFDKESRIYFAGRTVSGKLIVQFYSPKTIRDILIEIKGKAEVSWTEARVRSLSNRNDTLITQPESTVRRHSHEEAIYSSEEGYFAHKFSVLQPKGTTPIPSGQYIYKFSYELPEALPSSFESDHGFVRYTIIGSVDSSKWKINKECKVGFIVVNPVDLNNVSAAQVPIRAQIEQKIGLFQKGGTVVVKLNTPTTGFVSEQVIPVTVEIVNTTKFKVNNVECQLTEKTIFKARSPTASEKSESKLLTSIHFGHVNPHDSSMLTEDLAVPSLPHSNLKDCKIIDIEFKLILLVRISQMVGEKVIHLTAPLILGTIPFIQRGERRRHVRSDDSIEQLIVISPRVRSMKTSLDQRARCVTSAFVVGFIASLIGIIITVLAVTFYLYMWPYLKNKYIT